MWIKLWRLYCLFWHHGVIQIRRLLRKWWWDQCCPRAGDADEQNWIYCGYIYYEAETWFQREPVKAYYSGFVNQLKTPNLTQFHIQHHSRRGDRGMCALTAGSSAVLVPHRVIIKPRPIYNVDLYVQWLSLLLSCFHFWLLFFSCSIINLAKFHLPFPFFLRFCIC